MKIKREAREFVPAPSIPGIVSILKHAKCFHRQKCSSHVGKEKFYWEMTADLLVEKCYPIGYLKMIIIGDIVSRFIPS